MIEQSVGIRDLKMKLSEYLRQVKAGQTILITEHGKPIGRIVPSGQPVETRMKMLAEAGFLTWNGEAFSPALPTVVNKGPRSVSDLVIADRDVEYLP